MVYDKTDIVKLLGTSYILSKKQKWEHSQPKVSSYLKTTKKHTKKLVFFNPFHTIKSILDHIFSWLTLYIRETPKLVLLQALQTKEHSIFENYNLTPLDMYNGLFKVNCIIISGGRSHQNTKRYSLVEPSGSCWMRGGALMVIGMNSLPYLTLYASVHTFNSLVQHSG